MRKLVIGRAVASGAKDACQAILFDKRNAPVWVDIDCTEPSPYNPA